MLSLTKTCVGLVDLKGDEVKTVRFSALSVGYAVHRILVKAALWRKEWWSSEEGDVGVKEWWSGGE